MAEGVCIAIPTYDGRVHFDTAVAALTKATKRPNGSFQVSSSLLAFSFNNLWAMALNLREQHGIKWFAMLHADIRPDEWWADTLIAEAEKHDADVMSAVVPIKNNEGLTTTGMSNPVDDYSPYCRITQTQINHSTFPPTFDAAIASSALRALPGPMKVMPPAGSKLLVNTGCFVARIDKPWAERVRFSIGDRIRKDEGGKFVAGVNPEDWQFSKDVAELGGRVMATTKVKLLHRGQADYASDHVWGLPKDSIVAA